MIRRFLGSTIKKQEFAPAFQLHINTGSSATVVHKGVDFIGDAGLGYHNVGSSYTNIGSSIYPLHQTERWRANFTYTIPIPNGIYTVKTYHNEKYYGYDGRTAQDGQRIFKILIQNILAKDNIDMFAEFNNKEVELTFSQIPVTNGQLKIQLIGIVDNAPIDGISIISQS